MNTTNASSPPIQNDEIDLFELCFTLWKNKWTIVCITLICTLLAVVLALFCIKPTYESKMVITPPYNYQIEALNDGLVLNTKDSLKKISPNEVYETFINSLISTNVQREFFTSYYAQKQKELTQSKSLDLTQENFKKFQKSLFIQKVNKDNNLYSLAFLSHSAETAHLLTLEYMSFANQKALNTTIQNRQAEVNSLLTNTESMLSNLRLTLSSEYSNELNKLQSALAIAESLNLQSPMEQPSELYMQGSKALSGKLSYLEEQKDNYSLNPEYRELTSIINFYKMVKIPTAKEISLYNIDASAMLPEKPIKPNKMLIVVIGFGLGGILAVMFVLIRQSIRNRYPKTK